MGSLILLKTCLILSTCAGFQPPPRPGTHPVSGHRDSHMPPGRPEATRHPPAVFLGKQPGTSCAIRLSRPPVCQENGQVATGVRYSAMKGEGREGGRATRICANGRGPQRACGHASPQQKKTRLRKGGHSPDIAIPPTCNTFNRCRTFCIRVAQGERNRRTPWKYTSSMSRKHASSGSPDVGTLFPPQPLSTCARP